MMTGTHGIGVRTPKAKAVAIATAGLARLEHNPNVTMFSPPMSAGSVDGGTPPISTHAAVSTTSGTGNVPNGHWTTAPAVTGRATSARVRGAVRTIDTRPDICTDGASRCTNGQR